MKSVRIPAKKLLASGPKFLAAGHIANFQTSPSKNAAAAASAVRRHSTDGGPAGQVGTAQQLSGLAG
ncbi:hypothetical protein B5E42_14165 [Flavonifractor sp. An10]|nr:hypothetical protein B5E42_14165 [Flavonifractor sp. An10]